MSAEDEKSLIERFSNRISNISYIQTLRRFLVRENRLGVIVDGPNMLRKVDGKQIKLEHLEAKLKSMGRIILKKVILDQHASKNLMQAITNSGYEPVVAISDLYVTLAIEAMKIPTQNKKINVIAICSRHARVAPIMLKLKELGIETISVGIEPGMSIAVKKVADTYLSVDIKAID